MARYTFNLPDIGEGIAEAEIVALHVKPGDTVEEDQRIADMMTDKATVEMESPVAGTVVEVAGGEGDVIAIGSMLVVIETGDDAAEPAQDRSPVAAEPAPPTVVASPVAASPGSGPATTAAENAGLVAAEPGHRAVVAERTGDDTAPAGDDMRASAGTVLASPAVRARAKELGVDLAQIKPQGRHVRHADLDAYLGYHAHHGHAPAGATRPDEAVRVIGLRRRIAENMAAAKRHIPHFTYVEEIDVTDLEQMRANLNASRGDRPKLTLLPFLIVAICRALPKFPMINARYDDEAGVVNRSGSVHLGMATQTDAGLMVPVIRHAERRTLWQLASEIRRLSDAARSGKAKSEELSGSTLTITSLGPLGGVATTPVINRPEVAIIGPNRIIERPMFVTRDGERRVEGRKLMNLSISCDHRVVDGHDAASFVQELRRLIETPVLLLGD